MPQRGSSKPRSERSSGTWPCHSCRQAGAYGSGIARVECRCQSGDLLAPNTMTMCGVQPTASEARVLGTVMRISDELSNDSVGLVAHDEKEQKFIVLTSRRWRIQGCGRGVETLSTGSVVLRFSSSSCPIFHTISLLSRPCLQDLSTENHNSGFHSRNYLVSPPASYSKNRILVSAPNGPRPHNGQVPEYDITFSISGDEPFVSSDELRCVNLNLVASKDGLW